MLNRFRIVTLMVALALGSLATLPGCDWLKSSGSTERSSPFLSGLAITPTQVLCGAEFNVSFNYDDPQGDILTVQIFRQREGDTAVFQDSPAWPTGQSLSAGTVKFPLSFTCDKLGGRWLISVQVVDVKGHLSNLVTGEITLNAL